ncbi:MAG: AraC family transcriptional regulator [Pseudomonadales bacterium]|nr:AraC family transcriptional regulator [Pseudomonadales bacterium]
MTHTPQINKAYLLIALDLGFTSAEEALENTDLSLEHFDYVDSVGVSLVQQLIRNVKKYSSTPNWPAIFGAHLGAASHGPVGYATLSAPTVGKAMATFVEWFQIRCETYSGKVIQYDENVEIIISDTTGDWFFEEMFFECFIRAFEILMQQLLGHAPKGDTTLHFKTLATDRQKLMEKAYDSQLFFGADTNKLTVPNDIWCQPSRLYDKDSYEFNLRKCQQLRETQDLKSHIDLQIRHIIRKHFEQMIVSTAVLLPPPTQLEICDSIHITERTLIRKLKDCNTSYKLILEEERQNLAKRLLKEARYTIYNVAEILGYRESANFCRAFKRWIGQSPTAYRRNADI